MSPIRSGMLLGGMLAVLGSRPIHAQPFDLSWNTIDCGGSMSMTGGTFALSATIGQPDAGVMSGGTFELVGGFWGVTLPAGVPTPTLVSAVSRKTCDLTLDLSASPRTSEPRQGGVTQVCFTYDNAAPSAAVTVEEDASCPSPPTYAAYAGSAVAACTPAGNDLCCTFTPALENARAYRLTVPSGSGTAQIELRGLLGDVNSDGNVNAGDRSAVVGVWTGPGFTCATDVNGDAVTNAPDRSIVVGAWTGGETCAP